MTVFLTLTAPKCATCATCLLLFRLKLNTLVELCKHAHERQTNRSAQDYMISTKSHPYHWVRHFQFTNTHRHTTISRQQNTTRPPNHPHPPSSPRARRREKRLLQLKNLKLGRGGGGGGIGGDASSDKEKGKATPPAQQNLKLGRGGGGGGMGGDAGREEEKGKVRLLQHNKT